MKPKPKPSFHVPFEEFPVPKLDGLLRHLEETKPDGWSVEVSTIEGAQHMDCMEPLVHILVYGPDETHDPGSMGISYQYRPRCKTAVRAL